jgi:hypothetical protein
MRKLRGKLRPEQRQRRAQVHAYPGRGRLSQQLTPRGGAYRGLFGRGRIPPNDRLLTQR